MRFIDYSTLTVHNSKTKDNASEKLCCCCCFSLLYSQRWLHVYGQKANGICNFTYLPKRI